MIELVGTAVANANIESGLIIQACHFFRLAQRLPHVFWYEGEVAEDSDFDFLFHEHSIVVRESLELIFAETHERVHLDLTSLQVVLSQCEHSHFSDT